MNKIVFLDRDGILNIDYGYTYRSESFEPVQGVVELLSSLTSKEYLLVIVTNQSGIARGIYSVEDMLEFNNTLIRYYSDYNIFFSKVYYCPHKESDGCNCRKPKSGMIQNGLTDLNGDPSLSYMIGDKDTDIDAALNANIKYSIKISSMPYQLATHNYKSLAELSLNLNIFN